jgi:beta-N-acetylhexosaminidase
VAIVGGPAHQALAADLAARSITLVRDPGGRLPLDPGTAGTVLAVMPRPADLTPADTSSTVVPGLAAALRAAGYVVDELLADQSPGAAAIAAARDRAATADTIVVGTIDAHRQPAQLDLVEALVLTGRPTVAVALRGPWDVALFPPEATTLATYSILPGSLEALAAVLSGRASAMGRLPVTIPR